MNQNPTVQFRSVISQGWTAWTLLLLLMIAVMAERGGFAEFTVPPGSVVLGWFVMLCTMQVVMSVLVRALDSPWFRWTNAGLAALTTLLIGAHHLHSTFGGATSGICGPAAQGVIHIIDTAHHGIGLLMCVFAVRWARQTGSATAGFEARLAPA